MPDELEDGLRDSILAAAGASLGVGSQLDEDCPTFLHPESLAAEVRAEATRVDGPRIEQLVDALAARDQFISVVSRELRNSVAPMVLLADHFEQTTRGMADSKLPSRVATLRRQLHKFVATIDQIAEVAKLRDGEIELDIAHVDMAAEVADVAVRMREQAAAGGVDLVVEAGQPTHGWWDRARLRQIASHLVSNAIRYGGVGTVEVTVRHRGPDAELEVRDHGPGIGAAELATLFDRLDHPSPRTSGGFGMGLFVVKAVARAMGGGVSVDHAAGGGARFRVLLPRG